MEGSSLTDEDHRGIIPRIAQSLFQGVAEADHNIEFTIKVMVVVVVVGVVVVLLSNPNPSPLHCLCYHNMVRLL